MTILFGVLLAAVILVALTLYAQSDGFARGEAYARAAAEAGDALCTRVGETVADEVLAAPLTGRPCVMWKVRLERYRDAVQTAQLADAVDFALDVDGASVEVTVASMALEAPFDPVSGGGSASVADVLARVGWEGETDRVILHEAIVSPGERVEIAATSPARGEVGYRGSARATERLRAPGFVRTLRREARQNWTS